MSIPTRIWARRSVRLALASLILLWPMIGSKASIPISALVLGALIAYEGTEDLPIVHWTIFLFVVELLYAMDIGMLSLSFVLTVDCISSIGRWVNLRTWSHEHGWMLGSFVRTVLLALMATALISMFSVLIGSLVHGHQALSDRLNLTFGLWRWSGAGLLMSAIMVLMLRWADEPLRKRITFGI